MTLGLVITSSLLLFQGFLARTLLLKFLLNLRKEVHVNSYASEVRGVPRENHSEVSFVEIQSRDFLVEKGKLACLSRAMDFHTLPNLRKICLDEEFEDLQIPYLGGLSVMVEFKSKHVCKNFLANESLTNCIKEKKTLG